MNESRMNQVNFSGHHHLQIALESAEQMAAVKPRCRKSSGSSLMSYCASFLIEVSTIHDFVVVTRHLNADRAVVEDDSQSCQDWYSCKVAVVVLVRLLVLSRWNTNRRSLKQPTGCKPVMAATAPADKGREQQWYHVYRDR